MYKNIFFAVLFILLASVFAFIGGLAVLNYKDTREIKPIVKTEKIVLQKQENLKETIKNTRENLIGFYAKSKISSTSELNIADYDFQGIALTSDGWVFTGSKVNNLENFSAFNGKGSRFEIVRSIDSKDGYFIKLNATNLPISSLAQVGDYDVSDNLIFNNLNQKVFIGAISSIDRERVKNIDNDWGDIKLQNIPASIFSGSGVFLENGSLAGTLTTNNKIVLAEQVFYELQEKNALKPSVLFKASYVDLKNNLSVSGSFKQGALLTLVESGGKFDLAGLKERDIILAVSGETLDSGNDLTLMLREKNNSRVVLEYLHGGANKVVEIR